MRRDSQFFSEISLRPAAIGLLVILFASVVTGADLSRSTTAPAEPPRSLQPVYRVVAGMGGEVYPFFANFASMQPPDQRRWGTVAVSVTNRGASPLHNRVSARVLGWSDQEIQDVRLAPDKTHTYYFAPVFHSDFYQNHEIRPATAEVVASDEDGHVVFRATAPLRLRSSDDIYWGSDFRFARYIASWVTPHDPAVEAILSQAKEQMAGRRLPGYEAWKSVADQQQDTYQQARAIYNAVKAAGVSYVKSSMTLGAHSYMSERIRMPRESLLQKSANCIDAVVLYASLLENLNMSPAVVLVPGHAFVGVRVAQDSKKYLFLDIAMVGRATFEQAVRSAQRSLPTYDPDKVLRIPIEQARADGIYPLP